MEANVEVFRLQVEKILSSDTFRNAESLRKLLRFLAEKAATGEADSIKEYTLGIDALGKPTTYDPRSDATVRIQVGRLRQKLTEYHAEEGKLDEWVITLPKGRFRLACDHRNEAVVAPDPAPILEAPVKRISWTFVAVSAVAVVSLVWAISVTVLRSKLADQTAGYRALWTSEMEEIWKPFLSTAKPVVVSIADPPFAQFEGGGAYRELTLNSWDDIQKSANVAKIRGALGNPAMMPGGYYVPIGEVSAVFSLGRLLGPRVPAISLLRASELSLQQVSNNNVIYVGASIFVENLLTGSPAVLEFATSRGQSQSGIAVLHPKSGEPAKFVDALPTGGSENGEVYALITKIPGPQQSSQLIAFTSNRTPARLAAVEWFTEPRRAADVVRAIRKPDGSIPQSYQVVLKVRFMNGVPTETGYVAQRELAERTAR